MQSRHNEANTALLEAAQDGNFLLVENALDAGADVNYANEKGSTALIWASYKGHAEIVRLFLARHEINLNAVSENGSTALNSASIKGHAVVVRLLLEDERLNFNDANQGNLALISAASEGHTEIVRLLLAKPGVNLNCVSKLGGTALIWASVKGYAEVVRLLLAKPEVNLNYSSKECDTALMLASRKGHTEIVRLLLDDDRVNLENVNQGSLALNNAVCNGHAEVVRLLLERDEVDVNRELAKNGETALSFALSKGYVVISRLLLARKETDIYRAKENGWTGLSFVMGGEDRKSKSLNLFREKMVRLLVGRCVAAMNDPELMAYYEKIKQDAFSLPELIFKVVFSQMIKQENVDDVEASLKQVNFLSSAYLGKVDSLKVSRKTIRFFVVAELSKRFHSMMDSSDLDFLRNEKAKFELICNALNILQKTTENKEKTAKKGLLGLIDQINSEVNGETKQHELLSKEEAFGDLKVVLADRHTKAIATAEAHSLKALLANRDLERDKLLSGVWLEALDAPKIAALRTFLSTLTPEERAKLKEHLYSRIKSMFVSSGAVEPDKRAFIEPIRAAYTEKRVTGLFEILRTGNNEKVDHNTGTWKDFCDLMEGGKVAKYLNKFGLRSQSKKVAEQPALGRVEQDIKNDPNSNAPQFSYGLGNDSL